MDGAHKHNVKSKMPGTKDHTYNMKFKKRPSSCKVLEVNSGGPTGKMAMRDGGGGWLLVLDLGMFHL